MRAFVLEAALPLTLSPDLAEPPQRPSCCPLDETLFYLVMLTLHAMLGAEGHASVLAAAVPASVSNRCAEPRKRAPVSSIAVETLEST
jgi:hypothetical protein